MTKFHSRAAFEQHLIDAHSFTPDPNDPLESRRRAELWLGSTHRCALCPSPGPGQTSLRDLERCG